MLRNAYRAGDRVPEKTVYWVHHFQHRLAHPAKIQMKIFPPCRTCGERVRYEKADVMPLVKIDMLEIDTDFPAAAPEVDEPSGIE